jgi:hypothetical protein
VIPKSDNIRPTGSKQCVVLRAESTIAHKRSSISSYWGAGSTGFRTRRSGSASKAETELNPGCTVEAISAFRVNRRRFQMDEKETNRFFAEM